MENVAYSLLAPHLNPTDLYYVYFQRQIFFPKWHTICVVHAEFLFNVSIKTLHNESVLGYFCHLLEVVLYLERPRGETKCFHI